ncbi:hypothetical protein UPYG_G00335040 [Umbra pygmaea]|uniref:DNA-directed RNA polymerase subunit n=1 Tax=Umbra pygmaea TaxID=75934 RepID=A0ABD0WC76_UMBPY
MANFKQAENDPKQSNISTKHSILNKSIANGPFGVTGGNKVAQPSLIPSFAEACKLVSAPYSCLVMDTHRRHIALSPMYLKKKRTGIQEELNTELLRYSEGLMGVPLAYDDIFVLGQHGDIYDDNGHIHLDIQANFVVFQPKKGQKLLGIVNKLSMYHVGCLVHGCFNASIPKPNHVTVDTWRDSGPKIGEQLEFEVCHLDADTVGVLLIRGRLGRTRVQELMAAGESSVLYDTPESLEELAPETDLDLSLDLPNASGKVKTTRKRKHRDKEAAVPMPDQQGEAVSSKGHDNSANGHSKEKRKKKENPQTDEDGVVECMSPIVVQGTDSSGYFSDKPNRKRKYTDDITPCRQGDSETPTIKRKTKLKQLQLTE